MRLRVWDSRREIALTAAGSIVPGDVIAPAMRVVNSKTPLIISIVTSASESHSQTLTSMSLDAHRGSVRAHLEWSAMEAEKAGYCADRTWERESAER